MASKLHQLIKAIITKTDKLVSIFCPYSVEEENLLPQVFLWPLYVCHDICVNVYTYTNNKLIYVIELKKKRSGWNEKKSCCKESEKWRSLVEHGIYTLDPELRQRVMSLKHQSKGWGWYWGEFQKSLMKTWLDEDELFGLSMQMIA